MEELLLRRKIMLSMPEEYIHFADPVIEELCVNAWGDGEKISKRQATKVKTNQFLSVFGSNKNTNAKQQATSFDEFQYFIKVTEAGSWLGCTNLTSITLPKSCVSIGVNAFNGCTSLERINLKNVRYLRAMAFAYCESLSIEVNMPYFSGRMEGSPVMDYEFFRGSGVTKALNLGIIQDMGGYGFFQDCVNLTEVWVPATVTGIERTTFKGCSSLQTLVCLPNTPPTTAATAFNGVPADMNIYVPYSDDHSILSSYRAANVWSTRSAYISELNEDGTIPE